MGSFIFILTQVPEVRDGPKGYHKRNLSASAPGIYFPFSHDSISSNSERKIYVVPREPQATHPEYNIVNVES